MRSLWCTWACGSNVRYGFAHTHPTRAFRQARCAAGDTERARQATAAAERQLALEREKDARTAEVTQAPLVPSAATSPASLHS